MDVEQPTVEEQLLRHAERQTAALESLRGIANAWSLVAITALCLLVIVWGILLLHTA